MKTLLKQIMQSLGPRLARNRTARDLFYFLARDFTPALATDAGRYRYMVNPADRTVGREVFLTGGFDDRCIEQIFAWLARVGYRDFRGSYFLDIGANIGTTSIPVVSEQGFEGGIAIEPEPGNFSLLRANVAANGLEERVHCLNMALSDEIGEAEMELCPVNLGDHRLRSRDGMANNGIYHEQCRKTVTVETSTFDSLVKKGSISLSKLGVVWMDTQGHEGYVLKGAHTLLQSSVPVVTEFWPYALKRSGGLELFMRLAREHYQTFIDLRASGDSLDALQPIRCLPSLAERYPGTALTDLLLLK